jgi:hypothetical protein
MAPKPKETGVPPTTTVPVIPPQDGPSTTVPPSTVPISSDIAAVVAEAIAQAAQFGFGASDGTTAALGVAGRAELDATGRIIAGTYTGQTKVIGSNELRPQYFEGDEYDITTFDAETIIGLQKSLQTGGYFLGSTYSPGIVRDSTVAAYKRALEDANQSFITFDQAIERSLKFPYSGGATTLKKYRVTAAADLESMFDKVSQNVLGRSLDTEQLNKLVKTYQGTELGSLQSQAGVSAQAPSAQAFGETRIEQTNQDESEAYKFAQYAQVFEKLLGQ